MERQGGMDLGLGDKVALVTGAGSQIGYGKAIVLMLAHEGCDIVAADIDLAGAEKTAAEVNALGRKAIAVKVDVRNGAEVKQMVDAAIGAFGKIDILVNNAGSSSKLQPFVKMTPEAWQYDIEVNLFGQMNVAHAVLPHMIARKYGRIVNTSGGAGHSQHFDLWRGQGGCRHVDPGPRPGGCIAGSYRECRWSRPRGDRSDSRRTSGVPGVGAAAIAIEETLHSGRRGPRGCLPRVGPL